MGWLSTILDESYIPATENIFNIPLLFAIPTYIYNSTESILTHLAALPQSIVDFWKHTPSRPITESMLNIMGIPNTFTPHSQTKSYLRHMRDGILPLLIADASINFFYSILITQEPIFGLHTSLLFALNALSFGLSLFAVQSLIKASITTICAPSAFHQADMVYPKISQKCKPECNNTLKLLNGSVNKTAAYYANLIAVWGLKHVPYVGSPLSNLASIYVSGRYIAGLTTAQCQEHEYLKSEATLSLGLFCKGFEYLLWLALHSSIGTPSQPFMLILNHIPLLLTISLAAHQKTLPLVTQENRTLVDPLEVYEKFTGFLVSLTPKIIKSMLLGGTSIIPWNNIYGKVLEINKDPYFRRTKNFFLPEMLHNWDNFINEPMISPSWVTVQQQLVYICMTLEEASRSRIINIAQKAPDKAALLFQYFFNFPKPIAKKLLEVLGNEYYMSIINTLRLWLQIHNVKKDTGIVTLSPTIPLRLEEPLPKPLVLTTHIIDQDMSTKSNKIEKPTVSIDPHRFFQSDKSKHTSNANPNKYFVSKYQTR